MNYTDNLHLLKPETNELFDVAHANSNAELIDAAITAKASLEQVASMLDQIIDTGQITDVDIGAVTTIREFIHNKGFRVGVGTTAEIEEQIAQGVPSETSLLLPTDSSDLEDFERVKKALGDVEDIKSAIDEIAELQTELGDVKAELTDTGWIKVAEYNSGWEIPSISYYLTGIRYRKIGNHVYIRGIIQKSKDDASITIFTLPEGYRPSAIIEKSCLTFNDDYFVPLSVSFQGAVNIRNSAVFDFKTARVGSLPTGARLMLDLDFLVD